jgi:hypothetical protein
MPKTKKMVVRSSSKEHKSLKLKMKVRDGSRKKSKDEKEEPMFMVVGTKKYKEEQERL